MDFGLENQESSWKSCGWNMCCFRVCFFTALEWILGGFGEVLSILGGCQEGTKTGPKANSSRNFIFWPCWSVLGGILKGFWECFGRVLEGFGWVFGVSGGILDTWGPLSGVFHSIVFTDTYIWMLLRNPAAAGRYSANVLNNSNLKSRFPFLAKTGFSGGFGRQLFRLCSTFFSNIDFS